LSPHANLRNKPIPATQRNSGARVARAGRTLLLGYGDSVIAMLLEVSETEPKQRGY
jgi:hypothetical protein